MLSELGQFLENCKEMALRARFEQQLLGSNANLSLHFWLSLQKRPVFFRPQSRKQFPLRARIMVIKPPVVVAAKRTL